MTQEPLGHLPGATEEEVIAGMTDEQKLMLLKHWFVHFPVPEAMVSFAINKMNLRKVFTIKPMHCHYDTCSQWTKRFSTDVKAHGIRKEYCTCHGKQFEHTESVTGPGFLFVAQYGDLEQSKAITWIMHEYFPWLKDFRHTFHRVSAHEENPEFYVNCEKQLYVPYKALFEQNIQLIIERSQWASSFWPKAGIWNPEAGEQFPKIKRFFDYVQPK